MQLLPLLACTPDTSVTAQHGSTSMAQPARNWEGNEVESGLSASQKCKCQSVQLKPCSERCGRGTGAKRHTLP
jgi:hypothetical protein